MYRNTDWAVNGGAIATIGAVIIVVGITIMFKRKKR
jgi:hypothetical protein